MTPSSPPTARCVALQGLRVAPSRRLGWQAVALLLTALALLTQGVALVHEKASGPAHVHIDIGAAAPSSPAEHERLHARGIAHHEHDADDASVLAADDDDDAGTSGAAKRLALDHGVVVAALLGWPATAPVRWAMTPAARFMSRSTPPLERPPR